MAQVPTQSVTPQDLIQIANSHRRWWLIPMVAGALLGEANYGLMINVGAVVVLASLAICAMPAIRQDRAANS